MKNFITFLLILVSFTIFAQEKRVDTLRHTAEAGIRYENFLNSDTYRVFNSILYGYKIKGKHDLFGRIIHQNRNGKNAIQAIVDFYPTYNKGYMFFSLRHSTSELFPNILGIGEVYRSIGEKYEASLGMRYIKPLSNLNTNVYVITGTFGLYHGNWFTYVRPMLNFLDDGTGWSGQITTRRYFGDGKTYLEASVLRGKDAGTTRPVGSIENSFGLDTYLFRLRGNVALPKNFTLSVGGDYSGIFIPKANNEKNEINIIGVDITIKKKF